MVAPRAILQVGNFLSAHGHNRGFIEELADRLEQRGWRVHRTSARLSRPVRLFDMLLNTLLWARKCAAVHLTVFSGRAFLWAETVSCLVKLLRMPLILSLHGGNLPNFARRWPGRTRRVLRRATIVFSPSRYLIEELKEYRADIHLMPNPLELGDYHFTLRDHPSPRLVWLRAFHSIYNPSLAPRFLSLLTQQFPSIRLTMVGPDKYDGTLQETVELATRIGVADRMEISGGVPKSEVPATLNNADVFINTSNIDNTPVSVLEAMACGLCVVSTDVGGIKYLLANEVDALVVPANDALAMANAVRRVLTDRDLAQRLSRNGRRKVEEFSWEKILPRWESVIERLAAGRESNQ